MLGELAEYLLAKLHKSVVCTGPDERWMSRGVRAHLNSKRLCKSIGDLLAELDELTVSRRRRHTNNKRAAHHNTTRETYKNIRKQQIIQTNKHISKQYKQIRTPKQQHRQHNTIPIKTQNATKVKQNTSGTNNHNKINAARSQARI